MEHQNDDALKEQFDSLKHKFKATQYINRQKMTASLGISLLNYQWLNLLFLANFGQS